MKKINLILLLISISFFACDLDINDDPSYPGNEDITPDLLFPSVQNAIAVTSCDIMFNYAGFFAQYFEQMPESNQFNSIADYSITESSAIIDKAYTNLYARALQDVEDIKSKTTNTADLLAVTAMRAFAFQLMVDNTSEAPYSEALQGSANASPKWDSGKDVYMGIIAELDAALAAYEGAPETMTLTDMMFDKDVNQWIGYVNALKLRMYMRMYDVDNTVSSKIVELVNDNKFFIGDAKLDVYADVTDNRSPFYGSYYALGTANHCAAYPIVSYMLETNDPRIKYAYNVAVNGGQYVGQMPGAKADQKDWPSSKEWKNADVSNVNYVLFNETGATRPAFLYTQANLQFLIAEAELRFNSDDAAAKTAYESAIVADFDARNMGGDVATFMAENSVSWDKSSNKLELIYMQKWAALFYMDNMEAWSEIRRTDIPSLSTHSGKEIYDDPSIYTPGNLIEPYRNGIETGGLFKRMFYPYIARRLNKNTPAAKTADVKVWWDVN